MDLHGTSIIGYGRGIGFRPAVGPAGVLHGVNPATSERLAPPFVSATQEELDRAVALAGSAFLRYRVTTRAARATFLGRIAENLELLGHQLVERTMQESALPEGRVRGERDRTCFQLRFFAGMVEEGSWVDARIDTADPGRKPAPKPDLRSMLRPLGPVAVFCASNFPLAFSVAGGDTASALAAGNPVVVKAHSSHPGTAELCGTAVRNAAEECGMPEGVFSLLFTSGQKIGQALVAHPGIRAGGFTGSRRGGLALLDIARSRPEPIPFYAEMSSVNPVFILPGAVEQRGPQIAAGLYASVTLGVGQFCTNPGVVLAPRTTAADAFAQALAASMQGGSPNAMLNAGIFRNYAEMVSARAGAASVRTVARVECAAPAAAAPALFEVDAETFLAAPELAEEVFGPSSLLVRYSNIDDALAIAASMEGNLTATIHAGPGDDEWAARLAEVLETKVGRILFQGFPTGVEVCQAMVHGGPFPSTSDGRSTSVGGRAIDRFVRPVCYQDAPEALLPEELRNENATGILRIVNGVHTRDPVG